MAPSTVRQLREAQANLAALVDRDLRAVFAELDITDARTTRDALLKTAPEIVARYVAIAQTIGADWYELARTQAGVTRPLAVTPPTVSHDIQVTETVRRAARDLFTDHPETAIDAITVKCQEYALSGVRDTIAALAVADSAARGWRRVTSGGGCDFCDDLAQDEYTEAGADFQAHAGCLCTAEPLFA